MLKLIKMEMKKSKMGGYLRGAIITNVVLICILCIIVFGSRSEGEIAFENYNMAFILISSLAKGTFIVFASVLLAKLVIEEYKNNTITLLFLYPINRKKMIASKLIIVTIFTFINTVISNILLVFTFILLEEFFRFMPGELTNTVLLQNIISIVINAITSSFMALIPLYFGMKRKSVPTTIISSLLIVAIVCSNNNGFTLSSIIAVPIILAIIGIFIAYLSIYNIEHVDITK